MLSALVFNPGLVIGITLVALCGLVLASVGIYKGFYVIRAKWLQMRPQEPESTEIEVPEMTESDLSEHCQGIVDSYNQLRVQLRKAEAEISRLKTEITKFNYVAQNGEL